MSLKEAIQTANEYLRANYPEHKPENLIKIAIDSGAIKDETTLADIAKSIGGEYADTLLNTGRAFLAGASEIVESGGITLQAAAGLPPKPADSHINPHISSPQPSPDTEPAFLRAAGETLQGIGVAGKETVGDAALQEQFGDVEMFGNPDRWGLDDLGASTEKIYQNFARGAASLGAILGVGVASGPAAVATVPAATYAMNYSAEVAARKARGDSDEKAIDGAEIPALANSILDSIGALSILSKAAKKTVLTVLKSALAESGTEGAQKAISMFGMIQADTTGEKVKKFAKAFKKGGWKAIRDDMFIGFGLGSGASLVLPGGEGAVKEGDSVTPPIETPPQTGESIDVGVKSEMPPISGEPTGEPSDVAQEDSAPVVEEAQEPEVGAAPVDGEKGAEAPQDDVLTAFQGYVDQLQELPPSLEKDAALKEAQRVVDNLSKKDESTFSSEDAVEITKTIKDGEILTGIKKAAIAQTRESRGTEPADIFRTGGDLDVIHQKALDRVAADPLLPDRLVTELKGEPRTLDADEVSILDIHYVNLQKAMSQAEEQALQAEREDNAEGILEGKRKADYIEGLLVEFEEMARATGTKWSDTGRMLQRMIRQDYTLEAMKRRARRAKGFKKLSEDEHAKIEALHVELEKKTKALEEREAKVAEIAAKNALDEVVIEAKKQEVYHKSVYDAADRIVKGLEKRADAATIRLRAKLGRASAGIDPTILADIVEIGVAKLARATLDFAQWAAAVRKHVGEDLSAAIEPYLETAYDVSKKKIEADLAKIKGPKADRIKKAVNGTNKAERKAELTEKLADAVEAGKNITPHVKKMAESIWQDGVRGLNPMIDALQKQLDVFIPGISRQETMDALSGRGKFWHPNQEEIKREIRDLSTQARLVGHQIDVEAKKPLPRTGYQPDQMSDAARQEQQRLAELKKKFGVVVTDPTKQLASALSARKTYYRNRLNDLKHEIKTRERIVKSKTSPPTDMELEAMKVEYKKLKAEHDEIFHKDLTPEQQLEKAMAAIERESAEIERKIKAKEFMPKKATPFSSADPKFVAAKARLEALRDQFKEFRDLDANFKSESERKKFEREKTALEASIAEKQANLAAGKVAPVPKAKPKLNPELDKLRKVRDDLNKQIREARKKPEAQRIAEQLEKKLKAVEKRIAQKEAKIAKGDISKEKKTPAPTTLALEAARKRLAEVNKELNRRRHPPKSKAELALNAKKRGLTQKLATMQRKMATGDFSTKKKSDTKLDSEAIKIQGDIEAIQDRYNAELELWKYNELDFMSRRIHNLGTIWDNLQLLQTTGEFSVVLRQGGLYLSRSPLKSAEMFIQAVKAFGSERIEREIELRIRKHEDYPASQVAGLRISRPGERLNSREDFLVGDWARKIWGVKNFTRFSGTYLNLLRWNLWQSMRKTLSSGGIPSKADDVNYARLANYAGGHAGMKLMPGTAKLLRRSLYSYNYLISRIQLVIGHAAWGGSNRAKAVIAIEYARMLLGYFILYEAIRFGLNGLRDDEDENVVINMDPISADYLKIRDGDTRLDIMMGLQQLVVLMARTKTGKYMNAKGDVHNIRPQDGKDVPYGKPKWWEVMGRFALSKAHPGVNAIGNLFGGEDFIGNYTSLEGEVARVGGPITWVDVYQALRAQNTTRIQAMAILAFLGAGLSTHRKERSKRQSFISRAKKKVEEIF